MGPAGRDSRCAFMYGSRGRPPRPSRSSNAFPALAGSSARRDYSSGLGGQLRGSQGPLAWRRFLSERWQARAHQFLAAQRLVGEDCLAAVAGDNVSGFSLNFNRILLIGPQKKRESNCSKEQKTTAEFPRQAANRGILSRTTYFRSARAAACSAGEFRCRSSASRRSRKGPSQLPRRRNGNAAGLRLPGLSSKETAKTQTRRNAPAA